MAFVNDAIKLAKTDGVDVKKCLVHQREQLRADLVVGRDKDLYEAMNDKNLLIDSSCEPMKSQDPLYVLYTSGTTGQPKGVVRDTGGHAVALRWAIEHVYDAKQSDVFWAASDVGWVVGSSFIVYAPLLLGCTTVMYEGKPVGTPDHTAWWRLIEQHKVNTIFSAPTALRAIKQIDSHGVSTKDFDLSSLRVMFVAGERADPATLKWAENALGVHIRDHWW